MECKNKLKQAAKKLEFENELNRARATTSDIEKKVMGHLRNAQREDDYWNRMYFFIYILFIYEIYTVYINDIHAIYNRIK